MIDNRTTNYNLPLPNINNLLQDDVGRLATAISGLNSATAGARSAASAAASAAAAASGAADDALSTASGIVSKSNTFSAAQNFTGGINVAAASGDALTVSGAVTVAGAISVGSISSSGGISGDALSITNAITSASLTTGNVTSSGTVSAVACKEGVVALNSGEIDCSTGSFFTKTITEATTFSTTNFQAGQVISLKLTNGGAYTVTWPAAWQWPGGEEPDLTASGIDLILVAYDGTNYIANAITELAVAS